MQPIFRVILQFMIIIMATGQAYAQDRMQLSGQQSGYPALTSVAQSQEGLLKQARQAYAQRHILTQLKLSLQLYAQALQLNPDNLQINLEYAAAIAWLEGYYDREGLRDEQFLQNGLQAAQKVLASEPDNALAHYLNGILHGFYGRWLDSVQSFSHFGFMEQELDWVINNQPDLDYGGVYRALGRYYAKLPGVLGGDDSKAETYYLKAKAIAPEYLLNNVLLAELYQQDGDGDDAKIKEVLEPVLNSQDPPQGLEPEWHMWQARAQYIIKALDPTDQLAAACE